MSFQRRSSAQSLTTIGSSWLDRIYTPLVTLWVFLGQVLSADHSCRAAVARLIAHLISRGESPCSAETGAYCQARKRLPEEFFSSVARQTGRALEDGVDPQWRWKQRRVYAYDGSSVSMPDTAENQRDYPQPDTQKPGLGFPLARLAAVFSLACGAVLDVGICRYAGKGQSELGMLRTLWDLFRPGDVMLADRLMCTWTEMVMLKQRGVDCVCRLTSHRKADFRRGERLGKDDHIVKWPKPAKPRSIDRETYNALPEFLMVRECRVRIEQPGFRVTTLIVATTLLDAVEFTRDDLAQLYRARWNAELDLRSLKQTLQMDVLRCKTPELVRKEIWTHILAYNLIRTDYRSSRNQTRHRTANDQLQGSGPNTRSLPASDRSPGRTQYRIPPEALRTVARCDRHPPGCRSARSIRTSAEKTPTQALWISQKTKTTDKTRYAERTSEDLSAIRRCDRGCDRGALPMKLAKDV